eukprot:scaffold142741_cov196-Phaeocystis_antarctica.AAC.1
MSRANTPKTFSPRGSNTLTPTHVRATGVRGVRGRAATGGPGATQIDRHATRGVGQSPTSRTVFTKLGM